MSCSLLSELNEDAFDVRGQMFLEMQQEVRLIHSKRRTKVKRKVDLSLESLACVLC